METGPRGRFPPTPQWHAPGRVPRKWDPGVPHGSRHTRSESAKMSFFLEFVYLTRLKIQGGEGFTIYIRNEVEDLALWFNTGLLALKYENF